MSVTVYPLSRRLSILRNTIRDAGEPISPIDQDDALDYGWRIVGAVYSASPGTLRPS